MEKEKEEETYAKVAARNSQSKESSLEPENSRFRESRTNRDRYRTYSAEPGRNRSSSGRGSRTPSRGDPQASRLPRYVGGLSRDNPQYHSVPKSRWKQPPDPEKYDRPAPSFVGPSQRRIMSHRHQQQQAEPPTSNLPGDSDFQGNYDGNWQTPSWSYRVSHRDRVETKLEPKPVVEPLQQPQQQQIPGLFFVSTPKPITSRRNSRNKRQSSDKEVEEQTEKSAETGNPPAPLRRRGSRRRRQSGRRSKSSGDITKVIATFTLELKN